MFFIWCCFFVRAAVCLHRGYGVLVMHVRHMEGFDEPNRKHCTHIAVHLHPLWFKLKLWSQCVTDLLKVSLFFILAVTSHHSSAGGGVEGICAQYPVESRIFTHFYFACGKNRIIPHIFVKKWAWVKSNFWSRSLAMHGLNIPSLTHPSPYCGVYCIVGLGRGHIFLLWLRRHLFSHRELIPTVWNFICMNSVWSGIHLYYLPSSFALQKTQSEIPGVCFRPALWGRLFSCAATATAKMLWAHEPRVSQMWQNELHNTIPPQVSCLIYLTCYYSFWSRVFFNLRK